MYALTGGSLEQGPKPKTCRAESRGEVIREGATSPLVWEYRSAVSSPSTPPRGFGAELRTKFAFVYFGASEIASFCPQHIIQLS